MTTPRPSQPTAPTTATGSMSSISILPHSPLVAGWKTPPLLTSTKCPMKHTTSSTLTFENLKKRWPRRTLHQRIKNNPHMDELCSKIKVGDRCEVEPGAKRGTVKFVGRAEALGRGFWVGVQYDEPLGKHDGMVKGIRFFECPQGHGAIVRPEKVKVGGYPERDPFEEDEIYAGKVWRICLVIFNGRDVVAELYLKRV